MPQPARSRARSAHSRAGTRRLVTETVLFPAAAAYAAAAVPLSVWGMLGGRPLPPGLATPAGHAHELLFGYALAVVAGFLIPRTTPRQLALLAGLWLAARASFLAQPGGPIALAAGGAFAATVGALAAPRLMKAAKRWRNRLTGPLVLAICLAVVAFQMTAVLGAGFAARVVLQEAVLLFALLMLYFGGRLMVSAGVALPVRVQPRLEGALLLVMIGAIVTAPLPAAGPLPGLLLIAGGTLALVRLLRWWPWGRGVEVLGLGVGYGWLGVGLLLLGASRGLGLGPPSVVATHAITVGALGTLTTHVMARTRLLRLRVPLAARAPWLLATAGGMSAAALARMLGAGRPDLLLLAAGCWTLAQLALLGLLARDR